MINPWILIGWAMAFAISTLLVSYGGAVLYAFVRHFIIMPRSMLREQEHRRRIAEIEKLNGALKGKTTNTSRILWHAIQKAGGEIEIRWDDVLDDTREYIITRRKKGDLSISLSTRP